MNIDFSHYKDKEEPGRFLPDEIRRRIKGTEQDIYLKRYREIEATIRVTIGKEFAGELKYTMVPHLGTFIWDTFVMEKYRLQGVGMALSQKLKDEVVKYSATPVMGKVTSEAREFWGKAGYV